jgi:hypothetical protein
MLRKLLQGLMFGFGLGIALAVVLTIYFQFVLPNMIQVEMHAPDMAHVDPAEVVPIEEPKVIGRQKTTREFRLRAGNAHERRIPENGGMLSISVIETPAGNSRPSTFQAWVTESEAFVIKTEGLTPKVLKVRYPSDKAVDYAGKLVYDNVGFREQNMTVEINHIEVQRLKEGKASSRDEYLNGSLRITEDGVVFLIPNEFGT